VILVGKSMDIVAFLRAVFALALVLGLILGLAYALRRYAPQLMARLQAQRGQRRLQVVETLVLDPARRLVLVRIDDTERVILLGEGSQLGDVSPLPKPALAPVSDPDQDLF
jgi:flagellar protein FliO/FliZ